MIPCFRVHTWPGHSYRAGSRGALGCPDLHLSDLVGVVVALACHPVDAIRVALMGAVQVTAIEVGAVAAIVPPGPMVRSCTIHVACIIVILVMGCEWHAAVACQGVSWKDSHPFALRVKAEPIPDGQGQLTGPLPCPPITTASSFLRDLPAVPPRNCPSVSLYFSCSPDTRKELYLA